MLELPQAEPSMEHRSCSLNGPGTSLSRQEILPKEGTRLEAVVYPDPDSVLVVVLLLFLTRERSYYYKASLTARISYDH